jgi:uncharacterized protein (DUF3084 family)
MLEGIFLILALLVLGGVIATVGDRIGTKVGKARLSLFNLRPKKTATLVTIATGTLISASTLGILFATSEQLRRGVFEFNDVQRKLRRTRTELGQANQQKDQVAEELNQSRKDQVAAQKVLQSTNESLKKALSERQRTQAERDRLESTLRSTEAQIAQLDGQLDSLNQQVAQLETEQGVLEQERAKLQGDRDRLLTERDSLQNLKQQALDERDKVIAQQKQKEAEIAALDTRRQKLEYQKFLLAGQVVGLEKEAEGFRAGNVGLRRGETLIQGLLAPTNDPALAQAGLNQLLQEADRTAKRRLNPNAQQQILQISPLEVQKLLQRISDGKTYILRVLSAANYLLGEPSVAVIIEAIPNQEIARAGDEIASTTLDPNTLSEAELQRRISQVLDNANSTASRLGLVGATDIGKLQGLLDFAAQVRKLNQPVKIRVLSRETSYASGPMKIELVASQNGQVLFRTGEGLP